VNTAVAVGEFRMWLVNQTNGGWYGEQATPAVSGLATYSYNFKVPSGAPSGTYKLVVYYRSDTGVWTWQANASQTGTVTVF